LEFSYYYITRNDFTRARTICDQGLQVFSQKNNPSAYRLLAFIRGVSYFVEKKYDEAFHSFSPLRIDGNYCGQFLDPIILNHLHQRTEPFIEAILLSLIESEELHNRFSLFTHPFTDRRTPVVMLCNLYQQRGEYEKLEMLCTTFRECDHKNMLRYLSTSYFQQSKHLLAQSAHQNKKAFFESQINPPTQYNYRTVANMLRKYDIPLVAVQYPMRSIEQLKTMLNNDGHIIFVDNEALFKEHVLNESYNMYFVDSFAGDFGHCTGEGNQLLAQNIADTIEQELFRK